MSLIDDVRAALAGSSASNDADVAAIYLGLARARLAAAKSELVALETVLSAREQEMVRRHHVDGQQLALGGSKS